MPDLITLNRDHKYRDHDSHITSGLYKYRSRPQALLALSWQMAPQKAFKTLLSDLCAELGRETLIVQLHTGRHTLYSWTSGRQKPSRAALRIIWLLWCLTFLQRCPSPDEFVTWCATETKTDLRGKRKGVRPKWHPNPQVLAARRLE